MRSATASSTASSAALSRAPAAGLAPQRRRRPRLKPLAQALAGAWLLASPLWLQAAQPLPTGLQVVQGQATVATQGALMTVRNSPNAILNWQSFNIAAGNKVYFDQVNAASKVLNRVTGNDPSLIFGNLASNGQVWLLNPNGVLFGQGARVDVASLVTSTLRLNDNDFLAGRYRFSAATGDAGTVRNEGALSSSFGGQVVLLGERVENTGRIEAAGGQVNLAAARSVELVDTGLPNLTVKVNVPAGEVLNLGSLAAAGGLVDVYGGIVNQQGLVQADSLGTDAQGQVVLRAADTLTLGEASRTQSVGAAKGSTGGRVDLIGAQVAALGRATVDVSGAAGGGAIRFGGGAEGKDTSVPNARAAYLGPQALLRADATGASGSGGHIVMWSDEATRAYGRISARGGSVSGDGGFAETSGGWLDARLAGLDLSTRSGRAGTWLLDPHDITITSLASDTNISGGPIFTSTGDSSVVSTATLKTALDAGTSVTVQTGTAISAQAGDILVDGANLSVNPSQGVTLTLRAARDIVVNNSSLVSTGSPLALDFISAGNGEGAIEIRNSTITTAGGSLTLRGAGSVQLPLPGGGFTAALYQPAIAHFPTTAPPSQTSSGGQSAVVVFGSTINLGSGTFKATGLSTFDNRDGVRIGASAGNTVINAASFDIVGYTSVIAANGIDLGVYINGNGTDLTATQSINVEGAGRQGVEFSDGARITLNAAPASGATFTVVGRASDDVGIGLLSDNFDPGTAGRGTRITVNNASLAMTATSVDNIALIALNNSGAPGPLLDLANATGASFTVPASGNLNGNTSAIGLADVSLVLPSGGTTTFTGDQVLQMARTDFTGNGGTLNLSGQGISLANVLITSSGGPLSINFATTGASTEGVGLDNTIVTTNGGNLRFGAVQQVCSVALGCSGLTDPWVEAQSNNPGLTIVNSVIDAGTGRITGGGAARSLREGVFLDGSSITAAEISLQGRADNSVGLRVVSGSYGAVTQFNLSGLSASSTDYGLLVEPGSTLRLSDPAAGAGSQMNLLGNNRTGFNGLGLNAGSVGSGSDTVIGVDGGSLLIQGTTSGDGTGLVASGSSNGPGGLLINALGATTALLEGINESGLGGSLVLQFMNVLGPQAGPVGAKLELRGGARGPSGEPGMQLQAVNITSGSPVLMRAEGLQINDSLITGDAGITLNTVTGAGAPLSGVVAINNSILRTTADGAVLRIEGTAGDEVVGDVLVASGAGVSLVDSSLLAEGAGGGLVIKGRGSVDGGNGVNVVRSTLTATNIDIRGLGSLIGDGVFVEDLTGGRTTFNATNLTISGIGADSAFDSNQVGVRLGNGTVLHFTGRGLGLIEGDTVLLGNPAGSDPLVIDGDAAAFQVSSTGSMRVVNSMLDFLAGGGTGATITLFSDSDSNNAGRIRVENTSLTSGGQDISFLGGTGPAVGVYTLDPQGTPLPRNLAVLDGSSGVLLAGSNVISFGSGTFTAIGRAPSEGRPDVPTNGGGWGIDVTGSTLAVGGSITMQGHGGDKGTGIDVGVTTAGVSLNLQANVINLTGTGVGIDPNTSLPYGGLAINSASNFVQFGGGAITLTSLASPMLLSGGITLTAEQIAIGAAGALTMDGAVLSSSGALNASALGAPQNGSLFSLRNTTMAATGALDLTATTTAGGTALSLLSGVDVSGDTVSLSGTATGTAGITGDAATGRIAATGGQLTITGRNTLLVTPGIVLDGGWLLSAPDRVELFSDGTTFLRPQVGFTASPTFSASQRVGLTVNSPAGVTLGVGSALEASNLATAVAGLPATATVVLTVPDPSGLSVDVPFSIAQRLRVQAEQFDFTPTGSLSSTAAGDAVLLTGLGTAPMARFQNLNGAGAISATNGRWLLNLQTPTQAALGGLLSDFTAYNLAAAPWAPDAGGNLVTPAAGSGVGFAVSASAVSGTALTGLLSKVYDASTGIVLDPLGWSINGLIAGDTLTLSGINTATMADKNVGTGKAVTLDGGSIFTVLDANARPVFGYSAPVFSATVTPAPLALTGVVVANKVYDAGTSATLSNAGTLAPLGADAVTVGLFSASFGDKTVGNAKAVTLSGLSLTGADAGNYTLVAPTGLVADITPLALNVTGLTALNKVYDATTAATLNGTAAISPLAGDTVLLSGSAAASFADKNAGLAKPVSVGGFSLTGADAGNYTLQQPAGLVADITVRSIALQPTLGVSNKVYDATTAATLTGTASIPAPLPGDTLTLQGTAVGSFADKAVGSAKPVSVTGLSLGGADAANYTLAPLAPALVADITPAPLVLTGTVVANKVYDGSTAATLSNAGSVAPLGADVVGISATGAVFSDKAVGTAKPVSLAGLSLTGADAGNYTLVPPVGVTADITPLALPVTGLTALGKVYDTTTLASLTGTATINAVAGDAVVLAGTGSGSFADKNAGLAKPVTVSGFSLSGADAGNYTLQQPAGLSATITAAPLLLTGLTAANKVYDATTAAALTGTAVVTPLAGDSVTLGGAAAGSFADKAVGTAKPVTVAGVTLTGADAANYTLVAPAGLVADVTPAALTLAGVTAANKVYDASAAATANAGLTGVIAGDAVSVGLTATFADANVAAGKTVSYTAATAGADAANYTLAGATGTTTANITPATLSYTANAITGQAGSLPTLTGTVLGFVGGETLATATTGTLVFSTTATASSLPGSYAIDGSGLVAANYQFVQAAGNASALTLQAAARTDPATNATNTALFLALQSVQVALAMSSPTEGRVLDVTPAFAMAADGGGDGGLSFQPVNFSLMPRDEMQSLLAARAAYKKKVFSGSLFKLEQDPTLADARPCKTEAELQVGDCVITEALKTEIQVIAARAVVKPRRPVARKIKQAVLPNIERKLALLIGVNKYADKRVPELSGSVQDARAVRALLEARLGYETTVLEDPSREAIIRAFNKLALEADANDSVVIYYAGHGEVVSNAGVDTGYWLPSDVNPDQPTTWLANADIARMVAAVGSRQLMLISDSCYSGTLAGGEKVQLTQASDASELLKRKAAVVMSSGGNEPVADEGREGHSYFAWHLMRALEGLNQWQVGGNVFERVRAAVVAEKFPQTPQYGASRSAGHQGNTDYLFERREIEGQTP